MLSETSGVADREPLCAALSRAVPPVPWGELGGAAAATERVRQRSAPLIESDAPLPDADAETLLADLALLFEDNLFLHSETLALPEAERAAFVAFVRRALQRIGAARIRGFRGFMAPEIRQAWLAAIGALDETPALLLHDTPAGDRVRYCLYGVDPEPRFHVATGEPLLDEKARSVLLFGEHWAYEHNLLVQTREPHAVRFEAAPGTVPLVAEGGAPRTARELQQRIGGSLRLAGAPAPPAPPRQLSKPWWRRKSLALALRLGALTGYAKRFDGAWVLSDRVDQANDNAEVLFRHLHARRPDLNAWFAVRADVPVYRELRRAGARVVAYGSVRHYLLMRRAAVFACSQSDTESRLPFGPGLMHQSWRFVYLKHGVLHTDHHRRFNPMQIQQVLAVTPDERSMLSADRGPYRFLPSEVPLTGMPRHDRLQAAIEGRRDRGKRPDALLIAPTWRIYLGSKNPDHSWSVVDGFAQTDYVRQWRELLRSDRLREACERAGLEPVFLMHPRFERHAEAFGLPAGVRVADYRADVSQLLARTALLVTDYSSLAFEAAYAEAPTVYYQFDREQFYSGGHSGLRGEYDHAQRGFGPVAEDAGEAAEAVAALLSGEHPAQAEYARRVAAAYPARDGENCSRAVAAIESLLREV